jgi:phosphate-selective porin OprO/OprP
MTVRHLAAAAAIALAAAVPAVASAQAPGATTPGSARRPRDPVVFDERGITFNAADGITSLTLRFRIQEWAFVTTASDDDLSIARSQLAVRRARVRFESVVWDPRLTARVQLSFSRGDQDFENSNFPNVLRDANVTFQATPRLALTVGQGKLPGNRQRVISSGEQQFPDRSIVNGAFTVDRDVGFFAAYEAMDAALPFAIKGAVTGGEGRNAPTGGSGLAYTGRVEVLPLGDFTGGGDYFESDLRREPAPRLSIGAVLSRNDRAVRTGGQLGRPLFAPRGMTTGFVDVLYKHAGFSASAELARRDAPDPITTDGTDVRYVLAGDGFTAQASWLTRAMLEPALRYSVVVPHRDLAGVEGAARQRQVSAAITRYLKGHRVKVQLELLHDDYRDALTRATRGAWTLRTSLEAGI